MSGIEIAGLVLGSIPLVIAALEHYEDILDPTIALFKYHGELGRAIRELRNQHTLYEPSIQVLLIPITSDQELSDMMDNSDSPYWKDADIGEALQAKLGNAHSAYMQTTKDIEGLMTTLAEKLNMDGATDLNRKGLEAITSAQPPAKQNGRLKQKFEFKNRIKFTMKRQKVKKHLEELERCVEMLDKFHTKAEKIQIEEPYRAESRSKLALPLSIIQQNAIKLYNAFSKTWCSSHSSHSAGPLLEQRLVKKPQRGMQGWQKKRPPSNSSDSNCFAVSLRASSSLSKWLDVEFRLVDCMTSTQRSSTVRVTLPASSSNPSAVASTALPYANPSQLQIITNLCSVLESPCHPCIGFCLDADGHLRGAYKAQQRSIAFVEDGVSLQDLLKKQIDTLSPQDKYTLSITLTLSLLQLSHTPWLQNSWNKTDIIFLRAKEGTAVPGKTVDVKHPYLTREHKSDGTALIRQNTSSKNDSSKLLALGIMLLEIVFGQPIEELHKPEDLGPNKQPNELTNFQAVRRWLQEKEGKGEVSWAFHSAIGYCLKCFVDPSASLQNEEFSKTIEAQILAPLEEEMSFLLYGPPAR